MCTRAALRREKEEGEGSGKRATGMTEGKVCKLWSGGLGGE